MGFARLFGGHDQPKVAAAKEASPQPAGADVPYWKRLPKRYEQLKRKAAEVRRRREQQEKRSKQAALLQEKAQQRVKERQEKKLVKKQQQQQQQKPQAEQKQQQVPSQLQQHQQRLSIPKMDFSEQVALGTAGNEHACMEDLLSPRSVFDSARSMEQGQEAEA
ncbi:hypothetical protein CLOP_g14905 [Closterium sp. NIES-67]|nr:hypothetical protein CLOP_g14905 [Closterium sp. NIES-67]